MIDKQYEIDACAMAPMIEKDEGVILVDVRTGPEFRELCAESARHLPLSDLNEQTLRGLCGEGETIYFVCGTGARGAQACRKAQEAGFSNAVNVKGGMTAWKEAGLPVKAGRRSISLDRQVRIAAGMLVLIGVILGMWLHPAWLGLSAFVGAGLVFAGITDNCGMAMTLARMPWNR